MVDGAKVQELLGAAGSWIKPEQGELVRSDFSLFGGAQSAKRVDEVVAELDQ